MGGCIAIFLLYVLHALTFGEETADDTAGVFIGAKLTRGTGAAAI